MKIHKELNIVDEILGTYKNQIGDVFDGYKNHVYRMIHFCYSLYNCSEEDQNKIQIAGSFHDIGLWTDNTVDYLPPSIIHAKKYLAENGLTSWEEEITLMIDMHHKVTEYKNDSFPLVEIFRKGDLTDFSLGFVKNGINSSIINEVKEIFPNAGFHSFLMGRAFGWVLKNPFNPAPIMKW
ncbi:MAG: hypothetical protein KDK36_09520 [Leptospiraceae bacterium]|nr:hypothetical protein [Leptospiraceae bacterium]